MQLLLLFLLFILFPICGIQALLKGEVGFAIFFFTPITILICYLVINYCIVLPRQKRHEAAHKMYKLPTSINHDYGELWDKEFQIVIKNAIDTTTDFEKRNDLLECQKVAKQMTRGSSSYSLNSPFNKINKAFRLTGCNFIIIDSEGKTITQIV